MASLSDLPVGQCRFDRGVFMRIMVWGMLLSLVMLSGCATLMLEEYGSSGGTTYKEKTLGKERIVAFTR